MPNQKTTLNKLITKTTDNLGFSLLGPWKYRSIGLISILMGFYLGSNLTVYALSKIELRPLVVMLMVLIVEIAIRTRDKIGGDKRLTLLVIVDNLRLGCVYAIVLEAFKLGS